MALKSGQTRGWLELLAVVFSLIGAGYTGYTFLYNQTNSIVTTTELEQHDKSDKSHPSLVQSIKDCESKVDVLNKELEEDRDSQIALGARLVRMLASEQESERALKAASANYYEQEYLLLVKKGASIEEAMLGSLRQPWYTRPRRF